MALIAHLWRVRGGWVVTQSFTSIERNGNTVPLIFMHYPKGTFSEAALNALADQVTTIALRCEKLPNTTFVRSTTWIYTNELPLSSVFVAGRRLGAGAADPNVISMEIKVFAGGLDDGAKQDLIEQVTDSVKLHAGIEAGKRAPIYIILTEIDSANWGVFGSRVTLESLSNPPDDATPL